MEELIRKLNTIPDVYLGFTEGILAYVKNETQRAKEIMSFIDNTKDITTSKVVHFVSTRPDFFEEVKTEKAI